jgi:hypothetical protein
MSGNSERERLLNVNIAECRSLQISRGEAEASEWPGRPSDVTDGSCLLSFLLSRPISDAPVRTPERLRQPQSEFRLYCAHAAGPEHRDSFCCHHQSQSFCYFREAHQLSLLLTRPSTNKPGRQIRQDGEYLRTCARGSSHPGRFGHMLVAAAAAAMESLAGKTEGLSFKEY